MKQADDAQQAFDDAFDQLALAIRQAPPVIHAYHAVEETWRRLHPDGDPLQLEVDTVHMLVRFFQDLSTALPPGPWRDLLTD